MKLIWLFIFACSGCVATFIGGILVVGSLRRGLRAVESAMGVVVGHEANEDEEGRYFTPIISFTVNGQEHRVPGAAGHAGRPEFQVGQRVRVFFPVNRPEEASAGRFPFLWLALLPLVLGLWFVILAAVQIFRELRQPD